MEQIIEPTVALEKVISSELEKENVTDKVLRELKEKYMPLTINGQEDRDGFEAVKAARLETKRLRVLASKICKNGREAANLVSKAWIAKEKEVVAQIEEVEEHLEKQEKAYEAEKDRIKAERKRQQDAALIERVSILTKIGAAFTGTSYDLEDVSYQLDAIREADSEIFNEIMLPKYQAIYDRHEAVRIAEEEKKKEEEVRLQKEREEFEAKQREMQEQEESLRQRQEELARKQQEADEKERKMRFDARALEIEALGFKNIHGVLSFENGFLSVVPEMIHQTSDDAWALYVTELKEATDNFRKVEAEKAETKRLADEESAKVEAERIEKERIEREEQIRKEAIEQEQLRQQQEEARKKEEAEAMGDSDKWKAYVAALSMPPEMKSSRYRKIAAIAKEKLEEIKTLKA